MFLMFIYVLLSILTGYGLFRIIIKFFQEENGRNLVWPLILGIINFISLTIFTVWFLLEPSSFSNDKEILWNIWMILFTIYTFYFYIFAVPTSFGMYLASNYYSKRTKNKLYLISSHLNLLSCFGLTILIYFIISVNY